MSVRNKISLVLGLVVAGLLAIFSKTPAKPTPQDLQRAEFKTSTQNLGVRFTEKIRSVFRFRWLRKY